MNIAKLRKNHNFFNDDGKIDRYSIYLIYIVFTVYLLAQHSLVFMYHDDWGIAVLDYGIEQTGFQGRNYSIADVLSFLSKLYENWSGRVV